MPGDVFPSGGPTPPGRFHLRPAPEPSARWPGILMNRNDRNRISARAARTLRVGILLPVLGAPLLAQAFTEDQWNCRAGPDGNWVCGKADVDAGPFKPAETAPVYSQKAVRDAAKGSSGTVAGQTTEQAKLTWVPRQALPQQARDAVPQWCAGAYQETEWTAEQLAADPHETPLALSAESAQYELDRQASLQGGVQLEQGARRVGADSATYDVATRRVVLTGDIEVQEPGLLLRGDAANVDLLTGDANVDAARFVLYEGGYRGSAKSLSRSNGVLAADQAAFTHCPPGNDSWQLVAGHIEIPEDSAFGVARNARLEIHDIPVFWTPYLEFPVTDQRQSGFLFPSLSVGPENGLDLATPYYLNLAPNYDATITPRLMTERGLAVEAEVRQLTSHMRNTVGGAFLPNDDNYDGKRSYGEFRDLVKAGRISPGVFHAEDRWLAQVEHHGSWLPGITTDVDFTGVSDRDYLRDLGTDLSAHNQPELDRQASLQVRRGAVDARLWAEDIQVLEDGTPNAYRRLPQVDLSWRDRFGDVPMIFGTDFQYAEFDRHEPTATGLAAITGTRSHIVPRFTLPLETSWGWMKANFAYDYTSWRLDNEPAGVDSNPSRTIPTGSIDMGLRFERDTSIGGTAMLQTLEPRIFYLYKAYRDQSQLPLFDTAALTFDTQQLFRDNRFSGIDRIGDANQVSLALTQRLISRGDGTELINATVGRILYFDDRDVTLSGLASDELTQKQSGWITDLVVRLGAGLDARALWVWNSEDSSQDQTSFRFGYRSDNRHIFNAGYRKRGNDIEQLDVNFAWPMTPTLALIGRSFYDLKRKQAIETFGGVQYDDCCWRLRLVGREYRRPYESVQGSDATTGVFLEVVMKGLAGFDGGLESILEDGIHGYRNQGPYGTQL